MHLFFRCILYVEYLHPQDSGINVRNTEKFVISTLHWCVNNYNVYINIILKKYLYFYTDYSLNMV